MTRRCRAPIWEGSARKGLPVVYTPASPEFLINMAALYDLACYYRLPVFSFGGCSDAKVFGEQASLEGALWLMLAASNGGNLSHDVGYIDNGLATSYQQLVVMDEVRALLRRGAHPACSRRLRLDAPGFRLLSLVG